MLQNFKKFILRGNVVDLAVAIVIGAAFNSVIQSLVKDFITPLITGISGHKKGLIQGTYTFDHRFVFNWGDFISTLISFLIIAAVVFFFVVEPVNRLIAYSNRNNKPAEPTLKRCPQCLSEIPKEATRCAFCTSKIA